MLGRQRAVSIAFVWLVKLTIVLLDFLSVLLHVHRHFLQWYNKEKYPTDPIKIQRLRYYTFYFVFVRNIRTLGIIYGYITKVELVDCYFTPAIVPYLPIQIIVFFPLMVRHKFMKQIQLLIFLCVLCYLSKYYLWFCYLCKLFLNDSYVSLHYGLGRRTHKINERIIISYFVQ